MDGKISDFSRDSGRIFGLFLVNSTMLQCLWFWEWERMNVWWSFVSLFFFCKNRSNRYNNYSVYWFVISFSDICVVEKR